MMLFGGGGPEKAKSGSRGKNHLATEANEGGVGKASPKNSAVENKVGEGK